jgi:hypothetical protein
MTCDNVFPIRPDVEREESTRALLERLQPAVEEFTGLHDSLAGIAPDPSWSISSWRTASLPLRTRLPATEWWLDQLAEVDAADWPDTRWALDLGAARCRADQRLRQVRTALETLLRDVAPAAERARQLHRFGRGRTELQRALEQLCALIDAHPPARSCG